MAGTSFPSVTNLIWELSVHSNHVPGEALPRASLPCSALCCTGWSVTLSQGPGMQLWGQVRVQMSSGLSP